MAVEPRAPLSLRRVLGRADEIVAVTAMVILFGLLMLQVVFRYVFDSPFVWSEEAARYLFIVIVFMRCSVGVADGAHISIPYVAERLSPRARRALDLFNATLMIVFAALCVYWGLRASLRVMNLPTIALGLPTGILYLVLPIGMTLTILRLGVHIRTLLRR
jgi:TRAP-type C4-dicarboxylate transport system permease small subunit